METAVPVAVDVADVDLAAQVTRHVESHLGWQVVEDSRDLPTRLRLTDDPTACRDAVLVGRTFTTAQVQMGMRGGAREVVTWPTDSHRLADLAASGHRRVTADVWTVAGSAGGVGASTVSLAIAACLAWAGRDTVWVAGPTARRLAGLAEDQAGVVGSSAIPRLRVAGHLRDVAEGLGPDAVVVVDVGQVGARHQRPAARTLVARPDAALLRTLERSDVAQVVTVGTGGLRRDELARATADRTHVHLEWQFRVARAALRGRLPGAFPGALLGRLSPLLDDSPVRHAA